MISDNLRLLKSDIASICQQLGRDPDEITVIGVTKYSSIDDIQSAVIAGLCDIGENRVADALKKFSAMGHWDYVVRRHLIGHLQSNKARLAVELFDMIQSVDSVKLVKELNKAAGDRNKNLEILVQVNVSGESQKYGASPSLLMDLLDEVTRCSHVTCRGLMTIAPLTEDEEEIRSCFRGLREMFERNQAIFVNHPRVGMCDLSMGMSGDYRIALEEGATMLRVGTAIFK